MAMVGDWIDLAPSEKGSLSHWVQKWGHNPPWQITQVNQFGDIDQVEGLPCALSLMWRGGPPTAVLVPAPTAVQAPQPVQSGPFKPGDVIWPTIASGIPRLQPASCAQTSGTGCAGGRAWPRVVIACDQNNVIVDDGCRCGSGIGGVRRRKPSLYELAPTGVVAVSVPVTSAYATNPMPPAPPPPATGIIKGPAFPYVPFSERQVLLKLGQLVSDGRKCSTCQRELSKTLDVYYGRDAKIAGMCVGCRPRGA